ncbi:MAG: translation initiation factor eIF-2B [Pyrobaculum sp.]|jgi:translation initiation factor eIF-2B subunit delta
MDELAREWVRGATWLVERAAEAAAAAEDPMAVLEEARRLRPGMGSLDMLYIAVREAVESGVEPRRAAARFLEYIQKAKAELDKRLASLKCPPAVATISLSRAVARLLELCGVEVVYLMESRPGVEFRQAYVQYSKFARVVPIPDSAVGAVDFHWAVSGLDGLYLDYGTNKVGTLPLFTTAEAKGASIYVVFESYKVAPIHTPPLAKVRYWIGDVEVEVPLFDKIPHRLLKNLVTDLGTYADSKEVLKAAVEKIFNYIRG